MQSIARHLGISQATVSNALCGRGRLSESTRQRVLAAAAELGYRPNTSARAIRTRRFGSVGLLIGARRSGANYLREGLIEGLACSLNEAGLHLNVAQLEDQRLTDPRAMPLLLRELLVDGLLISYIHGQPPEMKQLLERFGLPAIWITSRAKTDCVAWDDRAIGQAAALHLASVTATDPQVPLTLLSAFCQDPALPEFLTCAQAVKLGVAQGRILGFLEGAEQVDRPARICLPTPVQLSRHGLTGWVQQVMKRERRPEAVFFETETLLPAALLGTAQAGRVIGGDLKVLAIAGAAVDIGGVRLDTLVSDRQVLSRAAVAMLLEKMQEPRLRLPRRLLVPHLVRAAN